MNKQQSKCPVTGRPLPDGYYLHPTLKSRIHRLASDVLIVMPEARAAQLGLTRRAGAGAAHSTPRSRLPINVTIYEDVDDMRDTLFKWGVDLLRLAVPGAPITMIYSVQQGDVDWPKLAAIMQTHADRILRWKLAPMFLDECEYAVSRARRLTQPGERQQLLRCPLCYKVDYYPKAKRHVTCTDCKATFPVDRARQAMLDTSYAKPIPRRLLQTALTAYGYQVKPATLRKWISRGKLRPVTTSPERYRPQDAVLLAQQAGLNARNC